MSVTVPSDTLVAWVLLGHLSKVFSPKFQLPFREKALLSAPCGSVGSSTFAINVRGRCPVDVFAALARSACTSSLVTPPLWMALHSSRALWGPFAHLLFMFNVHNNPIIPAL